MSTELITKEDVNAAVASAIASLTKTGKPRKVNPDKVSKSNIKEIIARFPDAELQALEKHLVEYCHTKKLDDCLVVKEKSLLNSMCKERGLAVNTDQLSNPQMKALVKVMEKAEINGVEKKTKTKKVSPQGNIKALVSRIEESDPADEE